MKQLGREKKGFTLIELLVVIAIIGLLSSIVLASVNQARIKAQGVTFGQNIKQLQLALQLYIEDLKLAPADYFLLNQTGGANCPQSHDLYCDGPVDANFDYSSYTFYDILELLITEKYISSLPSIPNMDDLNFRYLTTNPASISPSDYYMCGDQPWGNYTLEVYATNNTYTNTLTFLKATGLPKYLHYQFIDGYGVIQDWDGLSYCVTNY